MAAEDMRYFGGRIDEVTNALGGQELRNVKANQAEIDRLVAKGEATPAGQRSAKTPEKKAEGGLVSAGNLYQVGEGNKPELLMIPGDKGEVLSSDKVDKLAASGATGSGSGGGITINLSVHGVTKDQIINQLTNEILKVLQ